MITVTTSVGPQAAAAAVRKAQSAAGSVAVSVDHRVSTLSQAQSNDTLRAQQWALTRLAAEDTWVHSTGAGVTVAVIDTGVAAVPDLAGQLLPGYDWITDAAGGTADGNGHGTHVAGIIAAVANNHVGVAGIAPGAKILPLRVLDSSGGGYSSDVAAGVTYAANHGARVINMSLGGAYDPVLAAAVTYAQSK
ncbi:MAG: putative subtilase-family protease, partial [Mycobacterium sp.]|nr:putative subtilase-family protease [Mycobacterium sp.]